MSSVFMATDLRHRNDTVAVKLLTVGSELHSGARQVRRCTGCGAEERDTANFCSRCGAPVATINLSPAEPDVLRNELFRRETEALKRLNHPNIVRIHDQGWCATESCPYIVLEYLDRTLLEEIRAHPDPTDTAWCWSLMRLLADAVVQAHSAGVIHRDIKPTNILLATDGTPKLADFGISRLKHELAVGMTVSTFWSAGYASPEQREGRAIDERSDIYALGAVFYHLLSRTAPPPDGPTPALVDALPVPALIRRLLKRMIAPLPLDRPESAARVLQGLESAERQVAPAPTVELVVTRRACTMLCDEGLIDDPVAAQAITWLEEEFGIDDSQPLAVQRRGDGGLFVFSDRLEARLRCNRADTAADQLGIVAIETVYGPDLEVWKKAAAHPRVNWRLVDGRGQVAREAPAEVLRRNLDTLFGELEAHDLREQQGQEQRRERRELFGVWEKVLRYQEDHLAATAHPLAYVAVDEDEGVLTFTLKEPAPDDLPWAEGATLAVRTADDRRSQEVGTLLNVGGSTVLVGREGSNQSRARRAAPIPPAGELALNLQGEAAVIKRQQAALRKWRAGESVNPRLAEILTRLELADFDDPDQSLTFLQQELANDKRDAVRQALAARDIFLLQGPPGTGKTTAIAELILQILATDPGTRILVSSQSNVAVDNALSRVADLHGGQPLEVVRLGREDKSGHGAEVWRLDQRLAHWREEVVGKCNIVLDELREAGQRIRQVRRQAADAKSSDPATAVAAKDLDQCRDWLDETSVWAEALREDEERHAAIGQMLALEGLGTAVVNPRARQKMEEESEELTASIAEQRRLIGVQLDAIRALLPSAPQGRPSADPAQEIDRLRTAIANLEEMGQPDDPTQQLRTVVREWTEVFGHTEDFKAQLLKRANIVAATCLYSARPLLGDNEFDWVIIDEAGRATPPEVLIPLLRARRAILVGDERQLPPMVDRDLPEQTLAEAGLRHADLEESLFELLVQQARAHRPEALRMLEVQHRMHPVIGQLVSEVFYEGRLRHDVDESRRIHGLSCVPSPMVWYSTSSLPGKGETQRGTSRANRVEVDVIEALLARMEADYRARGERREIGVITGYAPQLQDLRERLRPHDTGLAGRWQALELEVATLDAFQGRDRDIILYSTVCSNPRRDIGFLADRRRVNVALSRARQLLIVVGDSVMLEQGYARGDINPFKAVLRHVRQQESGCQLIACQDEPWLVEAITNRRLR